MSQIIKVGSDVVIISIGGRRNYLNILGRTGVVTDTYHTKDKTTYAVTIPGECNNRSSTGAYWLPIECLKLKNNLEDKIMNVKNFDKNAKFAILTNPAKPKEPGTVGVYYGDLKPGDLVVCDYGYGNGALSARIVEISDREPECIGVVDCEIMGICDITEYLEHKTKRERRAELKKQMIEQAKRFQEEEYWRLLSESDPTMKVLYEEFKELEN